MGNILDYGFRKLYSPRRKGLAYSFSLAYRSYRLDIQRERLRYGANPVDILFAFLRNSFSDF